MKKKNQEAAAPRYAIFYPDKGSFSTNHSGGIGWTTWRSEAEELARCFGGAVVDADDFARNWPMYVQIAAISGEMPQAIIDKLKMPPEWLAAPPPASAPAAGQKGEG